jgi:hypothetical protein
MLEIFGALSKEETVSCRKLHTELLYGLYSSHSIVRMKLVGKGEGKKPFGRPRHNREVNIKTDIKKVGWADVNWIHLMRVRYKW